MKKRKRPPAFFVGTPEPVEEVACEKMKCWNCEGDVYIAETEEMEKMKGVPICNICYLSGELSDMGSETITLEKTKEKLKRTLGISDEEVERAIQEMKDKRTYAVIKKHIDEKTKGKGVK